MKGFMFAINKKAGVYDKSVLFVLLCLNTNISKGKSPICVLI